MIARRAILSPLILFAAVIGQLVLVNRMPLPGRGLPDLVLLVVAALGVTAGPATGLLAGFAGGLAIDVAPPGGHLAGEYALVYCLVGYGCGRIRDLMQGSNAERSATTTLTVMALGVAAGEAGKVALGMMLSDPDVTGPAIKHVLPAALIYDLLLCPFVLWVVAALVGVPEAERAPEPYFGSAQRPAPAFRQASAGAAPALRLAGSSVHPVPPPVRSEPRLRLAGSGSSLSSRTSGAYSTARGPALAGGRAARLNFASAGRGNQVGGASVLRAPRGADFLRVAPGKGWLRAGPSALGAPASAAYFLGGSPGSGWLRAGPLATPASFQRKSPGKGWLRPGKPASAVNWQGRSPGRGWLRAGRLATAPGYQPRSPGKGWARTAAPQAAPRPSEPSKGWLRPAKPTPAVKRKSPGRGWLRPAKPTPAVKRKSPGRGWVRPARPPRQNWYTGSRSTRWLRRGRRRRLLLGGRR